MQAGASAVATRPPFPAEAGSVAQHDRADFAQEFLRRNPAYRAAWARFRAAAGAASAQDEASRFGLVALFDPALRVRRAPAIWSVGAASQVVTLAPVPGDFIGAAHVAIAGAAAELTQAGAHHVVLDCRGVRHRLVLPERYRSALLAILLPPRGDALRTAACDAARRMFAGLAPSEAAAALKPSRLQHQRLALLLRVLDAAVAGATNREIGTRIVYPWIAGSDAAAWKATGERRRVQRLLAEARHLADQGYRSLLTA